MITDQGLILAVIIIVLAWLVIQFTEAILAFYRHKQRQRATRAYQEGYDAAREDMKKE
jgi:hypothetical protein